MAQAEALAAEGDDFGVMKEPIQDRGDAVFDLSAIAVVLSLNATGMISALGRACFIDGANGLRMSMLGRNQLLASIPQHGMIPNNV